MSKGLDIIHAPLLSERTSLGLGGHAIAEVLVRDAAGLEELPEALVRLAGPARPAAVANPGVRTVALGAGSNIMAADGDLPLVLLRLETRDGIRVLAEDADGITARLDGAMPLPLALARLAELGAAGLEGLAGIPGSVGGAVAMNAGSFGSVMGDAITGVTVFSGARGLVDYPRAALDLGYRHMAIPGEDGWSLVTGATLRLMKGEPEAIRAAMGKNMAAKKAAQPVTARSAGCVYKNPSPDAPAGRLLEEAGFKGKRLGGMAFSDMHANFMVNEGGGTFAAAQELMAEAEEAVNRRFGITLTREVVLWA